MAAVWLAEDTWCTCMGHMDQVQGRMERCRQGQAYRGSRTELRPCPCSSADGHPRRSEADDAMHMMPATAAAAAAAAGLSMAAIKCVIVQWCMMMHACDALAAACHHLPCNQLQCTTRWSTGRSTCACRPAVSHTLLDPCTLNILLPPLNTHTHTFVSLSGPAPMKATTLAQGLGHAWSCLPSQLPYSRQLELRSQPRPKQPLRW
jgi:hypothetical protein